MRIDDYLAANEAVLAAHDPEGNVGIYLDEWGTWYDPEEGHQPGFLYQQNTIRDAVVAALNFNIFHRHTERLHMANIAQTVNVLQAVILTEGEKMIRTPTYHAFDLYKPFMDATFVPVEPTKMRSYELGEHSVPQVSASAALTDEGDLVVALVNLHASEAIDVDVEIHGFEAAEASGRVLAGDAMDAHNTFDRPDAVKPESLLVDLAEGLHATLPPRSVSVVRLRP
jgi:alpha-N-arabinofuranosidase